MTTTCRFSKFRSFKLYKLKKHRNRVISTQWLELVKGDTKVGGKSHQLSLATWHSPTQRGSASGPFQDRLREEISPK